MTDTHIVTVARHIIEEERRHPEARGAFSDILTDMALAGKVISRQVNMAGLIDILGAPDVRTCRERPSRSSTSSLRR